MIKSQYNLYLIVLFFFLSNNLGFCQYYDITTLPVNNNNYSATLSKKMLLDNQGFLWYSTFNGIVKDMIGHNVFFKYNEENENSDSAVYGTRHLLLTSNNKIMACTEKGLKIIDVNTSKTDWILTTYPDTNSPVDFTSAMEDKEGNIWLGTSKHYLYCYTKDKKLIYIKTPKNYPNKKNVLWEDEFIIVEGILEDGSVLIEQFGEWFLVKGNSIKFLFNSKTLFPGKKERRLISIPNGYVFEKNTSGRLEFEGETYYYKYVKELNRQIVQVTDGQLVYVPRAYHKNMIKPLDFIFYSNDLIRVGSITKKKKGVYIINELDRFNLGTIINDVIMDPRGYILAESKLGISKIQYKSSGFQKYLEDYKKYAVNQNISCRAPVEDSKGNIYVHTYSGLFKKEVGTSEFKKMAIKPNEKFVNFFERLTYNIYLLDDDHLLAFGYNKFVVKLNLKTGESEILETPKSNDGKELIVFDAEEFNDDVLLATTKGIYKYNKASNDIIEFNFENKSLPVLKEGLFDLVFSEKNNTIWIASPDSGLYRINMTTNQIDFFNKKSKTLKLLNNEIKVVYEDNDLNIWIGTAKGAQKINPETLESRSYTFLNGLINDNISGIQESDDSMWLATFEGLVKINKQTNEIQLFSIKDGLTDNEFNFKSELKDHEGNIYFGGINGLVKFNPEEVIKKSLSYELFLIEYEKFDEETNKTKRTYNALGKTPNFIIPYYKNYITLNFAINNINQPEKNKYQYRIKKLGADWVDLGNYNTVQLIGLQPDNYKLEVRGFSSNGRATNILTYNLKVEQVFYKTYWFIALNIIALFGFIIWFNFYRRQKLHREYEQKNKIQELESKALRAQMNPHFIFNTLNGMQSVLLLKGERETNKYFSAFSKLIRLTLDMSNSEYILLKDEIKYIESYLSLEKIRLNERLKTDIYIDPELDIENNRIPCMLFQPVIENALIHGLTPKKGENLQLMINLKRNGDRLVAEVTDNGIGRDAAKKNKGRSRKEHKSWATHIMNERISITNSLSDRKIEFDIIDLFENKQASGTKVIIKIPLKTMIAAVH